MNRRDFLMIVLDVIIIAIAPATLIRAVVQAQHPVGVQHRLSTWPDRREGKSVKQPVGVRPAAGSWTMRSIT